MTSVPFSVRLDAETRARLEEEAQRVERPASQIAQRAIERYLDAQDEFRRMVEEALEEAEAGAFISAEAMHAWMASWGTDAELPPPEPDVFLDKR
jgi:predicted transcriptional regulator